MDLTEITKVQREITEEPEDILIGNVLDDISDSINDIIKKTNTKIIYNLEEQQLSYSRKNFKSIFYNLITNAIKYKDPQRDPVITISSKNEEAYLVMTVTDNGLGIDPAKKKDLFKMFKRLHDHVEGTGIGLYIVKRMLENTGGRIETESQPGLGSVFKVYFKR